MFAAKRVAIFDMDGTLIDSVGIWNEVDRKLIEMLCGTRISQDEAQKQRDYALRLFSKREDPYVEYCNFLKEKYGIPLSTGEIRALRYGIADSYLAEAIDYKPDAEKVLKALKDKGIILVIASTTGKSNMDIYRTQNIKINEKAKLDDYFSIIYTRDDAKEIKPNPEIYLRVMDELKVSPSECIVFEDSLIGIEAAKSAGIETVAMYDEYSDHERERINALADFQFRDYSELLAAISSELQR